MPLWQMYRTEYLTGMNVDFFDLKKITWRFPTSWQLRNLTWFFCLSDLLVCKLSGDEDSVSVIPRYRAAAFWFLHHLTWCKKVLLSTASCKRWLVLDLTLNRVPNFRRWISSSRKSRRRTRWVNTSKEIIERGFNARTRMGLQGSHLLQSYDSFTQLCGFLILK